MLTGSIEYNSYTKSNGEMVDSTRIVPGWCLTLLSKSSSWNVLSEDVFHNGDLLSDIIGGRSVVFLHYIFSKLSRENCFEEGS